MRFQFSSRAGLSLFVTRPVPEANLPNTQILPGSLHSGINRLGVKLSIHLRLVLKVKKTRLLTFNLPVHSNNLGIVLRKAYAKCYLRILFLLTMVRGRLHITA